LGDGNLNKQNYTLSITLNSELEMDYINGRILLLMNSLFGVKPHIRKMMNKNAVQVYFSSKHIHHFLSEDIGFPDTKRTNYSRNIIPQYIFLNKSLLKACLRGLFDTEGSLSIRHHKAIRLSIYNNCSFLLDCIYQSLITLDYHAIKKKRSVRLNRTSEIKRFFNEIGSNNPYKLKRYDHWLRTGKLENVHTAVM